jgi:hypothetical protein
MINELELNRIQEMMKVMLHYSNGGEVLSRPFLCDDEEFELDLCPEWNWGRYEYKIAPQKKVIYAIYDNDNLVMVSQKKAVIDKYSQEINLPVRILKEL